jgi:hypothetical protein
MDTTVDPLYVSSGAFSAKNLEYKRYRETVVETYSSLLLKYSSSLLIRNTPDFIDLASDETVKASLILKQGSIEVEDDDSPQHTKSGQCQICFCDVEQEFIILDCCNQEVHEHCIVHWASTGSDCPWCRNTLPEEIKRMGEQRTLPVSSQTLDSITESMPDYMRSVNPFGRTSHLQNDRNDRSQSVASLEEDTDEDKNTPIISGSRGASTEFVGRVRVSVASKPLSSSGSETDNDSLLGLNPFRRNISPIVINAVQKQRKETSSGRKRAPGSVLWPNVNAKKSRSPNISPEGMFHSPTTTTDEFVRKVHDQLRGDSVGQINALEESAKKRRERMVHEASGRMRQDTQAKKMKAMYNRNLPDVYAGDLVTLKLKPNQRANGHRGILCIAVEVSKTNTIRVVTEHGIISGSRDRDFWFSPDLYKVHQQNSPVWGKLVTLQNQIRNNTFVHETQPRLILSACHQKIYGGQVGRAKCGCLKGCTASCSCRKSSLPCGSNCKCMANCEYTQTYVMKSPHPRTRRKPLCPENQSSL